MSIEGLMAEIAMNRAANIEKIRAACIAANPEREYYICLDCKTGNEIRLADVLLAHRNKYIPTKMATFIRQVHEIVNGEKAWNLRKDDLTQQSDELLELVANLV